MAINTRGVNGYSGTRKGRGKSGYLRLSKKTETPTIRKNSQNTGAEYSTIMTNPSCAPVPSATRANATPP